MKRYILIAALMLSLVGCEIVKTGTRTGYISSYLYFNLDRIDVTYKQDDFLLFLRPKNPNHNTYVNAESFIFEDNPSLAERYYALCEKFGDIKPGGFTCYSTPGSGYPFACFEVVKKISITSDSDWSAYRPAGTLLNDLFTITYYTYYPYICNNYTGEDITEVTKPLAELQEDEMKLIQHFIYLNSSVFPVGILNHTLTISFELDTGRTATYNVRLNFKKPTAS